MRGPKAFVYAFLATVLCLALSVEGGYRYWLSRTFTAEPMSGISTIDTRVAKGFGRPDTVVGPYIPGQAFTRRFYDATGRQNLVATVPVNNLGWVSRNDYSLEPAPREFRIAIVGDSLAASITSDIPWPDVVQRELSADRQLLTALGVDRVSVVNISSAGAGYSTWLNLLAPIAKHLLANFLLLNVESGTGLLGRPSAAVQVSGGILHIDDVEIGLACTVELAFVRNCTAGPQWFVPPGGPLPPATILSIERRANDAALRRWLFAYPFPLLLSDNRDSIRGPALAPPVTVTNDSADAKTIQAIQREFRQSAVIDNPLQWEYRQANGVERLEEFLANMRAAGIDLTDMRKSLPPADDPEILSWYNMPYDGHWSDKGAEIYGKAVAQFLAGRLMQSAATATQTSAAHGLPASLHDDRP